LRLVLHIFFILFSICLVIYQFYWFFYWFQLLTLDMMEIEFYNFVWFAFLNLSQSYNSGHKFNKLNQVDYGHFVFSFSIWFFFSIHLLTLSWFEIELHFFFLSMTLSWTHDLNHNVSRLTWIDSVYFFGSFFNWIVFSFSPSNNSISIIFLFALCLSWSYRFSFFFLDFNLR
jgi:hypothetical protein